VVAADDQRKIRKRAVQKREHGTFCHSAIPDVNGNAFGANSLADAEACAAVAPGRKRVFGGLQKSVMCHGGFNRNWLLHNDMHAARERPQHTPLQGQQAARVVRVASHEKEVEGLIWRVKTCRLGRVAHAVQQQPLLQPDLHAASQTGGFGD